MVNACDSTIAEKKHRSLMAGQTAKLCEKTILLFDEPRTELASKGLRPHKAAQDGQTRSGEGDVRERPIRVVDKAERLTFIRTNNQTDFLN